MWSERVDLECGDGRSRGGNDRAGGCWPEAISRGWSRPAAVGEGEVELAAETARYRILRGARLVRGAATLTSALGLVCAMAHFYVYPYESLGIRGLSREVVQQAERGGAMVSIAIGLGGALVLHVLSREIRRAAQARLSELRALRDALGDEG